MMDVRLLVCLTSWLKLWTGLMETCRVVQPTEDVQLTQQRTRFLQELVSKTHWNVFSFVILISHQRFFFFKRSGHDPEIIPQSCRNVVLGTKVFTTPNNLSDLNNLCWSKPQKTKHVRERNHKRVKSHKRYHTNKHVKCLKTFQIKENLVIKVCLIWVLRRGNDLLWNQNYYINCSVEQQLSAFVGRQQSLRWKSWTGESSLTGNTISMLETKCFIS